MIRITCNKCGHIQRVQRHKSAECTPITYICGCGKHMIIHKKPVARCAVCKNPLYRQ